MSAAYCLESLFSAFPGVTVEQPSEPNTVFAQIDACLPMNSTRDGVAMQRVSARVKVEISPEGDYVFTIICPDPQSVMLPNWDSEGHYVCSITADCNGSFDESRDLLRVVIGSLRTRRLYTYNGEAINRNALHWLYDHPEAFEHWKEMDVVPACPSQTSAQHDEVRSETPDNCERTEGDAPLRLVHKKSREKGNEQQVQADSRDERGSTKLQLVHRAPQREHENHDQEPVIESEMPAESCGAVVPTAHRLHILGTAQPTTTRRLHTMIILPEAEGFTSSDEMNITVEIPSGRKMTMMVDPEMLGFELIQRLSDAGVLESLNDSCTSYLVCHVGKNNIQDLDMEHSLQENGVAENDTLVIRVTATAYGCPPAEDVSRIVPECMLICEEPTQHIEL